MRSALIALSLTAAATSAAEPVYVAVGYGGRRIVSTDGKTWEVTAEWAEKGGDDSNNLMDLAYGKGKFVAVGGGGFGKDRQAGHVLISEDGRKWREVKTLPFRVNPVMFGNDRFVAGGPNRQLWWSADGEEWKPGPTIDYTGPGWAFWFRKGAFGNGRFVFVGNAGKDQKEHWVVVSKDGETVEHAAFDLPPVRDLAFGGGRFVAVGPAGLRMSSEDGVTWEHRAAAAGENLSRVVWTGKEFVATGGKTAYSSPDGKSWKEWPAKVPCSVIYADADGFIGTSWPGQMWFSPDGKTWAKGKPLPPNGINAVLRAPAAASKQPEKPK